MGGNGSGSGSMLRCQSVVTAPTDRQHPKQRPQAATAAASASAVPVGVSRCQSRSISGRPSLRTCGLPALCRLAPPSHPSLPPLSRRHGKANPEAFCLSSSSNKLTSTTVMRHQRARISSAQSATETDSPRCNQTKPCPVACETVCWCQPDD